MNSEHVITPGNKRLFIAVGIACYWTTGLYSIIMLLDFSKNEMLGLGFFPTIVLIAAVVTVVFLVNHFRHLKYSALIKISLGASLLSFIIVILQHIFFMSDLFVVALFSVAFRAVGIGLLMQLWSLCFASIPIQSSIRTSCLVAILAVSFLFLVLSLPSKASLILNSLLPLFSAVFLLLVAPLLPIENEPSKEARTPKLQLDLPSKSSTKARTNLRSETQVAKQAESRSESNSKQEPGSFFAVSSEVQVRQQIKTQKKMFYGTRVLYGLGIGFTIGVQAKLEFVTIGEISETLAGIIGITLLFVLILLEVFSRRWTIKEYWLPGTIVSIVLLIFLLLIGSSSDILPQIAVACAFLCFMTLSSMQIAEYKNRFGMKASSIAFSEKAVVMISWVMGRFAGFFACSVLAANSFESATVSCVFAGAVIIGAIFSATRYSHILVSTNLLVESLDLHELVAAKCENIAARNKLTPREREVLVLLASGRSGSYIMERLSIAKGTYKTHQVNIYKKLDIHTKQELFDLLKYG